MRTRSLTDGFVVHMVLAVNIIHIPTVLWDVTLCTRGGHANV